MQLTHSSHRKQSHAKEIILLCDHIVSPANQGSLFRLADAFGVREVIFIGSAPDTGSSRLKRTARSTEQHISYRNTDTPIEVIRTLTQEGYTPVALEITSSSVELNKLTIDSHKILLIIGNEQQGISQEILEMSQHIAHITMYGNNSSMNVAQATGIALYHIVS